MTSSISPRRRVSWIARAGMCLFVPCAAAGALWLIFSTLPDSWTVRVLLCTLAVCWAYLVAVYLWVVLRPLFRRPRQRALAPN
jgi:hypothetical protein